MHCRRKIGDSVACGLHWRAVRVITTGVNGCGFRFRSAPVAVILLLANMTARAQVGDVQRVHDPCIIAAEGAYYLFCTGGGIAIRRSADLLRWERIGAVFAEAPEWTRQEVPGSRGLWAPDIAFVNGRYHLYYSVSTFGKNRSCIGLATNVTLDPADPRYKWIDQGKVVESTPGKDDFNAIDPNLVLDERDCPWLTWGSFWGGIKMCRIDPATGKPDPADRQVYALAARPESKAIEAPFMIRRGDSYFLFVSFDLCCRGAESTYRIMVGRARAITGPFVDRDGRPMLRGGGTQVLAGGGRVRGPGHNAILTKDERHWLVHHFYDADARGIATLQIRPLRWDEQGWPIAGEPIESPR